MKTAEPQKTYGRYVRYLLTDPVDGCATKAQSQEAKDVIAKVAEATEDTKQLEQMLDSGEMIEAINTMKRLGVDDLAVRVAFYLNCVMIQGLSGRIMTQRGQAMAGAMLTAKCHDSLGKALECYVKLHGCAIGSPEGQAIAQKQILKLQEINLTTDNSNYLPRDV